MIKCCLASIDHAGVDMAEGRAADYRFEVAISFAGDDKRDLVRTIAKILEDELGSGRVFFDEWFEAELAGPDAQIVLQNIYRRSTRLVVMCVCKRYAEKPWIQEEWRAIQSFERDLRDAASDNIKRLRFLPLRFGDGEIDGLFDTGIVPDVRGRFPKQIADLILERLRLTKLNVPLSAAGANSNSPHQLSSQKAVLGVSPKGTLIAEGRGTNPDADGSEARAVDPRRKVLWQFAYAFLRLDQLPSGGWAKSLPGWLEALLEGPDDVVISVDTRTKGGTDLTSRAFLTYLKFLRRLNRDKPRPGDKAWQIASAVHYNIGDKIGWDGGVGVGKPARVAHHIRHTLMGLLTFLCIYECTGKFPENISRVEGYLLNHLLEWKTDKSHPFASFCILAKIREKLVEMDFAPVWSSEPLLKLIDIVLPEMSIFLCGWERFELIPHGTCQLPANAFPFKPYEGFWRMERSSLLMYLPLLIKENGQTFNIDENKLLLDIIAGQLNDFILEVESLPDDLRKSCVRYHRDAAEDGSHPPLDFGLTAELLSLMKVPAIRGLETEGC